jgi:hypothetical protein
LFPGAAFKGGGTTTFDASFALGIQSKASISF